MKHTKPHFTNLAVALLLGPLAAAPLITTAQVLMDGDFDSLPVGSEPNGASPAGAWFFHPGSEEVRDAEFTIVRAPGQLETDHRTRLNALAPDVGNDPLVNVFAAPLLQPFDTTIVVSFDLFVSAEVVGGLGMRTTEVRPDNPSISLQTTGDSILLFWPATAGFWLQSTPNLTPSGTWLEGTSPPPRIGERFSFTIPISSPAEFFWLPMR